MYYVFRDEALSVEPENIAKSDLALGIIKPSELDEARALFDLPSSFVERSRCDSELFRLDVERADDCIFARLKLINPDEKGVDSDSIALFIKKSLLLVVDICDVDGSLRDRLLFTKNRFAKSELGIGLLVYTFLESVIQGDSRFIEKTHLLIDRLEREVLEDSVDKDFNYKLLSSKQTLLFMHNYYDQLLDVGEALIDMGDGIFDEDELHYFRSFNEKVKRLLEDIKLLRESVIQLRDAYNSALELSLNKTMKIFTVFTVFFSPLTFISGWYGMNFSSMGELGWRYGYALPISLSVVVIAILLWWFRRKGWM